MAVILSFILRYVLQTWLIAKFAKVVNKWLVKRYSLGENFEQQHTKPHTPNWDRLKWYAWFSEHAYLDNNDEIREYYSDFDEIYINEINEIKYVVLTDETTKTNYIAIRGTCNVQNALQDIKFAKDPSYRLGIDIHTGFHRTAEMIADDLIHRLDKSYTNYVTGHSLGGAEAVIVSWYLDFSRHTINECITFGQPKVTDAKGIRKMRGKIKLTRVVNETDVVPLVPPAGTHFNGRYAHGGELIKLLENGKYCYLEEPDSLNFGVNSFWYFASRESFSFYEIGKELPDHFTTNYIENIDDIIKNGEEVPWNERHKYLSDSMLGEWKE